MGSVDRAARMRVGARNCAARRWELRIMPTIMIPPPQRPRPCQKSRRRSSGSEEMIRIRNRGYRRDPHLSARHCWCPRVIPAWNATIIQAGVCVWGAQGSYCPFGDECQRSEGRRARGAVQFGYFRPFFANRRISLAPSSSRSRGEQKPLNPQSQHRTETRSPHQSGRPLWRARLFPP